MCIVNLICSVKLPSLEIVLVILHSARGAGLPTPSLTPSVVKLFDLFYSVRWKMLPHCSSNLYFIDYKWHWSSLFSFRTIYISSLVICHVPFFSVGVLVSFIESFTEEIRLWQWWVANIALQFEFWFYMLWWWWYCFIVF